MATTTGLPPGHTLAVAGDFAPYLDFTREEWSQLRLETPLTLTDADVDELRGINERIVLEEVAEVYLPLSRLLDLHVEAAQGLHQLADRFLGKPAGRVPYVIAIAGSVAVGKSTTARILQALIERWPKRPRVELIATDSFLFPNRILEQRGLLGRKGFPESYDLRALTGFLADLKSGAEELAVPVYSHLLYDILPDRTTPVVRPEVVIVEGLNVLQLPAARVGVETFVSDFFDFSIYVDAAEADIQSWFEERFMTLRETAFRDPTSFFRRFAEVSEAEALEIARQVWTEINGRNLRENIEPTRARARLVLEKALDHSVERVRLRKL